MQKSAVSIEGNSVKFNISLVLDLINAGQIKLPNQFGSTFGNMVIIITMIRVLRLLRPLSVVNSHSHSKEAPKLVRYLAAPLLFASAAYYSFRNKPATQLQSDPPPRELPAVEQQGKIAKFISYFVRFLHLAFIFTPTALLLPLAIFDYTRDFWLQVFLNAIKRAGIVWIKAFQYLSHRRDIIGQEMALKFEVLRDGSPLHSLQSTRKTIRKAYGKQLQQVFQEFETQPVASGSVSQVYRAKLNGIQVAVKVRHPDVGVNLEKDIDLLFLMSKFFSIFSQKLQIPVKPHSLKRILLQQLQFLHQKRNIDDFNLLNVDSSVRFPKTYPQSTNQVLIQEFIQGHSINFYEKHKHNMNRVIANIGARAFFSMLMKYNFIHADCHAGNIMVNIHQAPSALANSFQYTINNLKNFFTAQIVRWGLDSQFLRRLSQQNYIYQKQVRQAVRRYQQKAQIILIDVGMAIRLSEEKKHSFQSFLEEIIQGNALQCAKWIYRISQFRGNPLREGENSLYFQALKEMFTRVHQTSLQSLQGIVVLKQMLEVIRNHNMKIDGEISMLLTNMLILESIAKDLDPQINILRCAVPYLQYR